MTKKEIIENIWETQIKGQVEVEPLWKNSHHSFYNWSTTKYREGYILERLNEERGYFASNLRYVNPNKYTEAEQYEKGIKKRIKKKLARTQTIKGGLLQRDE